MSSNASRLAVKAGGRASVSGLSATVFGASGFYGRYMVDRLGRIGTLVKVPFRSDGMEVRHLRVLGDVGQIIPLPFHLRDQASIRNAIEGSNVVINLVGRSYETRNFTFNDVHVEGARLIAQAAREAGAQRFIHISSLGASPDSKSPFLRSKYEGEKAVLKAFPQATIFRPAVTFGWEDRFINRYGKWLGLLPIMPLINGGKNRIQPVFMGDVADAMVSSLNNLSTLGTTFELGGPTIYTLKEVLDNIALSLKIKINTITLPQFLALFYAHIFELSPWPPLLTRDEVYQMHQDAVVSEYAAGFADLDIKAVGLPTKMHSLLGIFRQGREYVETAEH